MIGLYFSVICLSLTLNIAFPNSCILILSTIILILQEQFMIENIPFNFFFTCKLLLKTLQFRCLYGESRSIKDYSVLLSSCFSKRLVFDLAFFQFNWENYFKNTLILIFIEVVLCLWAKGGIKAQSILSIEPLRTCLTLASSISDSISLENLLWRNQVKFCHLPIVFLSVVLDPILFFIITFLLKGEKLQNNNKPILRALYFGVFFTIAHSIFFINNYSVLIQFKKNILFNASDAMTSSAGIRLLNCLGYICLIIFDIVSTMAPKVAVSPLLAKENFGNCISLRRASDTSTVPTFTDLDDDFESLSYIKNKTD